MALDTSHLASNSKNGNVSVFSGQVADSMGADMCIHFRLPSLSHIVF